jgi:hypothetical protein
MANVKAIRTIIPDQITSFVIPILRRSGFSKKIIIKNVSAGLIPNSIRFNFNDDGAGNYWTLAPGESSPVFSGLRSGDSVNTDGVSGSGTAEILVWEE